MSEPLEIIQVTSGFGAASRAPFITLADGAKDYMRQMTPAEGRDLALNILQACDAAETDGFLVAWAKNKIPGISENGIALLLNDYRSHREASR